MEYDVAYLGYIRPLGDLLYMNNQNTSYDIRGQKAVACFLAPLHSSNYLKDFLYPFHRDGYHISHGGGYKKESIPREAFIRDAIGDCPLCLEPVIDRPIHQVNSFYHI